MRRVTLGATGIETPALGFGAAGLGSRVGAAEGARALAEAFDGGVTWLDLAPVYGAGQAEAIAAPFLAAHREASLARLGTDRVELFLLHGATAAEVARDDIRRALEDILAAGKARAVGVAGDAAAPGTADPLAEAAAAAGFGRITHSIFGVGATWDGLRRRLAADPAAARLLAAAGGEPEAELAAALLARAMAANPGGVVLVSMLSARSRARTLAAAAGASAAAEAGLARLLAGG